MKKTFAFILILALLLPLSAFADESDVVGCWTSYSVQTTGAPSMEMLYLAEDHTCYFVIQSFRPDEPGLGRSFVGTWELLDNNTVYAKTGNNSDITLSLYSSNLAIDKSTLAVFVNITAFNLF